MTEMVILPTDLSDLADPIALNRKMRAGVVQLNWSNVTHPDPAVLASLLQGTTLDGDVDTLGLETVPDDFADDFDEYYKAHTPTADVESADDAAPPPPAIWTAPERVVPQEPIEEVDLDEEDAPEPTLRDAVPTADKLRDELARLVIADLLGPQGGAEEEIVGRPGERLNPSERYLVGTLAPAHRRNDPEPPADDSLAAGGPDEVETGPSDAPTAVPQLTPSSIGLTACVELDAPALSVTARWGRYERIWGETLADEGGKARKVWRRVPMGGTAHIVPLAEGPVESWRPASEAPDVIVRGTIRRVGDVWLATFWLINDQHEPSLLRDRVWLFQPELVIRAPDGTAVFRRRAFTHYALTDAVAEHEERAMAMRYRKRREFAVGHGVGVHVECPDGDTTRACAVRAAIVPQYEVPMVTGTRAEDFPALAGLSLDMAVLATVPDGQWVDRLAPLLRAYAGWIDAQEVRIGDSVAELDEFAAEAHETLARCRTALARIEKGIALLDRDPRAADAFRFANRAMWQQRVQTKVAETKRRGEEPDLAVIDKPKNRSWRLFQLAFMLLNLPALTDLRHEERAEAATATADLLWFPTGGGKTEAYLGLTAYTLAIRRLQGTVEGRSGTDGVAVLMRYTLRLLTVQQFQRATALICACEVIRREAAGRGDRRWGETPFRLGLWVGMRSTPNRVEQSHQAVIDLRKSQQGMHGIGTPAQLTHCPWCGAPIEPGQDIEVDRDRKRTFLYCGDPHGDCLFTKRGSPHEGLPVLVVDEEIYRWLPALLIGTVDKFARMPWEGATQMLFGQVDGYCPRRGFRSPEFADEPMQLPKKGALPKVSVQPHGPLRPPDLIIQDELHLISGPLGTLVGLYETAVDRLCTWEVGGVRVRPKVIASTATVRRATDQMKSLFLRNVAIFPPQGLDAEDNFFARERPVSDEPGRLYLGICAPGRRLKAVLIRVYVAQLAAAQLLWNTYGEAADPWMTLVGYFNAMRELGGMRRLVEDDVSTRLLRAETLGLAKRRPPDLRELTSRMGAADIPRVLAQLEVPYVAVASRKRGAPRPIDVLLATNMISVGVDVRRLGAMVVAGQPKTTAEYIQATSRIGRAKPGLVITVLNWARPRDLSHYEQFEHYHATFYRHVEALSVTPFSPRARDRGLTGVLISYVRLAGIELNANDRAAHVAWDAPLVVRAVDLIANRAGEVTGEHATEAEVRAELKQRVDRWIAEAQHTDGGRTLAYQIRKRDGVTVPLLRRPDGAAWDTFTCLNSLRDVEQTVALLLDENAADAEIAPPFAAVAPSPTRTDDEDFTEDLARER